MSDGLAATKRTAKPSLLGRIFRGILLAVAIAIAGILGLGSLGQWIDYERPWLPAAERTAHKETQDALAAQRAADIERAIVSRHDEQMQKELEEWRVREAEEAKKRALGLHCRSGWDGSTASVVGGVKSRLNDPGSFEHVRSVITAVDEEGQHTVHMSFRAKNGFGGVITSLAVGVIRSSDCGLVAIAIE